MKQDDLEGARALHSLCDVASRQAEDWRSGTPIAWTEARAASLARSRRKRLQKVGVIVGSALLTLGVLAAQFSGGHDAPTPAIATAPVTTAAAAVPQAAPLSMPIAGGNPTEGTAEMAPALAATPVAPEHALPSPVNAQADAPAPAEPAASVPGETESQPDGSC